MKKLMIVGLATVLFAACNAGSKKKVLVMGRGEINANGTEVVMKDGAGHAEQLLELDEKTTDLSVDAGNGKTTMKVPAEPGYYILNLKKDTLVGSAQRIGSDLSRSDVMTQEELKHVIDSLEQLSVGANIKAGGPSFMVLPNEVKKITSNPDAQVFGPFTGIPAEIEAKDGKTPEIIKVYTNTQMRERIANLKKATI